jgi:DNA adenine methylase
MSSGVEARPVLKWAGGKRRLVDRIVRRLPSRIGTYYEPFVGGAAVFFELFRKGSFEHAVLCDRNPDLIAVYQALKQDVEAVIRLLAGYRYEEEEYYRVRAQNPRGLYQRAARIIYLNKTGYNGLYRVNRSGRFNVPFGRHKAPVICDKENLRAAARALQRAEIVRDDFERVCAQARPGDAVYLDPPYLPVSKTANFAAYDALPFGIDEHRRLADVFRALERRRVCAVLSNSSTPATREIFGSFPHVEVDVKRPINSDASRRGPVKELLVYTPQREQRKRRTNGA